MTAGDAAVKTNLRASVKKAMQRDASEAYAAMEQAPGRYFMTNPGQRLTATMDRAGIVVLAHESAASFSLRTTAYGCEGTTWPVADPEPTAESNRVSYARPELDMQEWYVNGPHGVEQGYSIAKAPDCRGTKVIKMEALGDVVAALKDADGDGRGDSVHFVTEDHRPGFVYHQLEVIDAVGKKLPAWITVQAGAIAIHFDDAAATYPVEVDPLIWAEQQILGASDGEAGDQFGASIALEGDTAIVGSIFDDDTGPNAGAAYVFVRNAGVWTQQAKLTTADNFAQAKIFGNAVALSGDTALIGSKQTDENGLRSGSAYVFVRNGGVWTLQARLSRSDGGPNEYYGTAVALSGDTALIGAATTNDLGTASGSVYVFVRDAGVWTQQTKIIPGDGAAGDTFGGSLAFSGDTVIVGAPSDDNARGTNAGAAYVLVRNGSAWTQQAKLIASDVTRDDLFGSSVALAGDTAIVGAFNNDSKGLNAGAAYVFVRSGSVWTEQAKLLASNGMTNDEFGSSVAIAGDMVVVGAKNRNVNGLAQGGAYFFERNAGTWSEHSKLLPLDLAYGGYLGISVALSVDTAMVGATFGDIPTPNAGMVHVLGQRNSSGDACSVATECASGFCVDGVCCQVAVCTASDACHEPGTCQPTTGVCSNPTKVCTASDQCHEPGTCNPTTGICSDPEKPFQTPCDDGNSCTQTDTCRFGVCRGANPVMCMAQDECHEAGTCDSTSGTCDNPAKPDGSPCAGGKCAAGQCVLDGAGGAGGAGTGGNGSAGAGSGGAAGNGSAGAGSGGAAGNGSGGAGNGSGGAETGGNGSGGITTNGDGSCSCRAAGEGPNPSSSAFTYLALAIAMVWRRRRSEPAFSNSISRN
ncbi:MAG TPA: MYXO-CTERM sorting domain-containing protein [Polyangium sp.]|nr:MYXO-CTERM sorting domain-containing protein [Polyangium sp.]